MQTTRLFEMIYLLLDKKCMTARDLSERFEVSVRTIYRDVEMLSAAGIPIYMTKGKGGGISLLPEFVLNKTILTRTERENVLTSLEAMRAVNWGEKNTALQKLSSFFGKSEVDWIEIDFSVWGNAQDEKERFEVIRTSILAKQTLIFWYAGVKGQSIKREVEPLKLCFKSGAWYLYAYCKVKCDYRFFKLRRIHQIAQTDTCFSRIAPAQVFPGEKGQQGEMVLVKIKFLPEAAYRVYDEFEQLERQADGSILAELSCQVNEWLFYYLATFGPLCEVLEPGDIREQMKIRLQKTLNHYS